MSRTSWIKHFGIQLQYSFAMRLSALDKCIYVLQLTKNASKIDSEGTVNKVMYEQPLLFSRTSEFIKGSPDVIEVQHTGLDIPDVTDSGRAICRGCIAFSRLPPASQAGG